jgi:hypothetical protein
LPSSGGRHSDGSYEGTGIAVQVELEGSTAIASPVSLSVVLEAGEPGSDGRNPRAEVNIVVNGVISIAGES